MGQTGVQPGAVGKKIVILASPTRVPRLPSAHVTKVTTNRFGINLPHLTARTSCAYYALAGTHPETRIKTTDSAHLQIYSFTGSTQTKHPRTAHPTYAYHPDLVNPRQPHTTPPLPPTYFPKSLLPPTPTPSHTAKFTFSHPFF